jgi:HemY protein
MKKLFVTFLLILCAIVIGFFVQKDPGYVLLSYNGWTIETSLWVALASFIIVFLLVYFVVRLIRNTANLDIRWHNWRTKRRHFKMHEKNELAIYQAIAGDWATAEKNFVKAAKLNGSQVISYLGAAFSANRDGGQDRCEEYLHAALQADPESEETIQLARAQLRVASEQWNSAEIILEDLHQKSPKNKLILGLLYQTYIGQENKEKLQALLPALLKRKIVDAGTAKDLKDWVSNI